MADLQSINGRKVFKLAEAAQLAGYTVSGLYYHIRHENLPVLTHKHAYYIPVSALSEFQRLQRKQRTKWCQMRIWWLSHQSIQSQISSAKSFQKRLRLDGIEVSESRAKTFLAKYQPYISQQQHILTWLEAHPTLRDNRAEVIRKRFIDDTRLEVILHTTVLAIKAYDRKHGSPKPPFDLTLYVKAAKAAALLQVQPQTVWSLRRDGHLIGRKWLGRWYILRASIDGYSNSRRVNMSRRDLFTKVSDLFERKGAPR